jgi:hypothetical protein
MINRPFDYYPVYITKQELNQNNSIKNLKYMQRFHHSVVKFAIHTSDMHVIKMGRGVKKSPFH